MGIEQIKVGFDNYSYIIFCTNSNAVAIVDPGYDASKALEFISSKDLELKYIIITHYHSDHTSDCQRIKEFLPSSKIVASESDGAKLGIAVDIIVSDGDRLKLGDIQLDFLLTPGHTSGGICIIVDNEALLTGDTLFIGDCGRTDLPGGNLPQMFETLQEKIIPLPDHLLVYPGHNYGERPVSTMGYEKSTNPYYQCGSRKEFVKLRAKGV